MNQLFQVGILALLERFDMVIKGFVGKSENTLGTPKRPWKKIYGDGIVPVGAIFYFGQPMPPEGFLVCNGAEVSIETYQELFNAIGNTYGETEENTFRLPDLMDRFPQGGTSVGLTKEAGLPNITGSVDIGCYREWSNNHGVGALYDNNSSKGTVDNGTDSPGYPHANVTIDASRSSSIYGNSETVQPPALILLPCIKY